MRTVVKMVSSGIYVGYSPIAPGTLGSILGALIYLQLLATPVLYVLIVMLLFILGFLICGRAEDIFGKKDSRRIVIDEIASMCLVYLFIKPTWFMWFGKLTIPRTIPSEAEGLITGFILFRIFDIIKPPPARRLEKLSGSKGIMLDDVVAACYTIIILFIIYIIKKTSLF